MPIFLVLVGLALIAAAVRGQEDKLFGILRDDFTGENNFVAWMAAIVILGGLGAIWKDAGPLLDAMLLLVLIALIISQEGFVPKFVQQVMT